MCCFRQCFFRKGVLDWVSIIINKCYLYSDYNTLQEKCVMVNVLLTSTSSLSLTQIFTPHQSTQTFRGTIAAMAADNLGSYLLGGFKAPSRSLRCCRHCMVTSEQLQLKVNS